MCEYADLMNVHVNETSLNEEFLGVRRGGFPLLLHIPLRYICGVFASIVAAMQGAVPSNSDHKV